MSSIYNSYFDKFKNAGAADPKARTNIAIGEHLEMIRRIESATGTKIPDAAKAKIGTVTNPITEFQTAPFDGAAVPPPELEALRVLIDPQYLGLLLQTRNETGTLLEDSLNGLQNAGKKMLDLLGRLNQSGALNQLYSGGFMTQEEFYFMENMHGMVNKALTDYVVYAGVDGVIARELNNSSALVSKIYTILTGSVNPISELLTLIGVNQNTKIVGYGGNPNQPQPLVGGAGAGGMGNAGAAMLGIAQQQAPNQQGPVYNGVPNQGLIQYPQVQQPPVVQYGNQQPVLQYPQTQQPVVQYGNQQPVLQYPQTQQPLIQYPQQIQQPVVQYGNQQPVVQYSGQQTVGPLTLPGRGQNLYLPPNTIYQQPQQQWRVPMNMVQQQPVVQYGMGQVQQPYYQPQTQMVGGIYNPNMMYGTGQQQPVVDMYTTSGEVKSPIKVL